MSTPPLIDLPTSACFARMVMSLQASTAETESPFTYESQTFDWEGHRWLIEFSLPNITSPGVAADWKVFGALLKGRHGRFLCGDPLGKTARGVASGSPLVNGPNQNGNTLLTDGWTPNTTNILRKADYIQIGTGLNARLHMITADVNSNGSGQAALSLMPALRGSPTDNEAIIVQNARGVFKLVDNTFSWAVNPGPVYTFSFSAVEAVNA